MSTEHVTAGEFDRTMTALRGELRTGFEGINDRLDTLNGQTRRHGESIAEHTARLTATDREIRDLKRGRPDDHEASRFTKGQKATAWGTGIGATLLVIAKAVGLL